MAEYRDGFITANGLKFHYLEWGDPSAEPVVLLHGTTSNAHSWDQTSAILAKKYHVFALDCRDHGLSDRSPGPRPVDALWQDVAATVDALGLEKFNLIGLSMGGRTAMSYAVRHPERLIRLVIEDIAPEVPAAASARVQQHIGGVAEVFDSIDEFVEVQRSNKLFASEEWLRYLAEHSLTKMPDGKYRNQFSRAVPAGGVAPPPTELWQTLANVTCPTLIIRGGDSDILDEALTNRMLSVIPNSRAVAIPRAGHVVHEDNPVDYNKAIAEFFEL